jgi:hypothetical protein
MESKRMVVAGLGAATLLVVAVGANQLNRRQLIDHGNIRPVALRGHVLTDSNAMAIPTEIAIVGPFIVAADFASDSTMHVIDRDSGRLLRSLGRRGSGPGEFEGVWTIDPVRDVESAFWAYDLNLKRATFIDLTESRDPQSAIEAQSVSFLNEATLTGPVKTADGHWLSLGFFPDGRVGIFNTLGERVAVLGDVPAGPENMHAVTRQQIRLSTLVVHPGRRRFAAMPRYASDFELFTLDGASVVVDGPVEVVAHTFRNGPIDLGPVSTGKTRTGYVDAAGSHDEIFALFSGRTLKDYKQSAGFGRYVHVFDWNGMLIAAYLLEDDTLAIAVDESGQTLYAVRHDPYPAIVRYDLAGTNGDPQAIVSSLQPATGAGAP